MTQEPRVSEYHDSLVALLGWIWGRHFIAPGGEGNVDKLVAGIDLAGNRVQDIGCDHDEEARALCSRNRLAHRRPKGR